MTSSSEPSLKTGNGGELRRDGDPWQRVGEAVDGDVPTASSTWMPRQ